MRWPLIGTLFLAACSTEANHLGNPLLLPVSGVSTLFSNAAYNERRGEVEVFVKTNFSQILADIGADGGAYLNEAMDLAAIPARDRPARTIQLRADSGLYENAPGALVTALMVYGG